MRICIVSPFDPNPARSIPGSAHVGGVERALRHLSRELASRGHDVTLLCSAHARADETIEEGVRVLRKRRRFTVLRAPVARLASSLPSDADIVHVAATYPFTTAPVLRAADRLGIPSVLDFHFEPAPGTLVGRVAAGLYRRIGPRAYPLAEAVLVRSMAYGQSAPSLADVPMERWRVVPNGVDTTRFHPNGGARPGEHLLFVGRLVPYKGVDVLLRTMATLEPRVPLVVVGDGPLRAGLEGLARDLGVDATFLGHVPDEELPGLYRRARVTVLPSVTRQEAFGISLLESMACGTPVVASSLPGVEEVARVGGLVSPPGDVPALAGRLREAMASTSLPRGPALSRRIHETYSWEAVTDRVLDVYDQVLDGDTFPPSLNEVNPVANPGRHAVL